MTSPNGAAHSPSKASTLPSNNASTSESIAFASASRRLPRGISSTPERNSAAVMAVMNTFCLIFTYSRGGWMALAVMAIAIVLLLGYWFYLFKRQWVLPTVLGGMAAFVLVSVILIPPVRARVLTVPKGHPSTSLIC